MNFTKSLTSTSNPVFKALNQSLNSKGQKKSGYYILSGTKIIKEFLKKPKFIQDLVYIVTSPRHNIETEQIKSHISSLDDTIQNLPQIIECETNLFSQLDSLNTNHPLLAIKLPMIKEFDPISDTQQTRVFLSQGDPKNLGAALRSCLAFNFKNIVLLKEAASLFLPQSLKAASGAHLNLNLLLGPSIHDLNIQNLWGLDLHGSNLRETKQHIVDSKNFHILIGEEGQGLPSYIKNKVQIPISKDCESLNASVALSIVLYELSI